MALLRNLFMKSTKKEIKLSEMQQLIFIKRLHRLLMNGYPIIKALEMLKWEPKFTRTSDLLKNNLLNGQYLDLAFRACQFHPTILSFLYFARVNNDIEHSLAKCITMFEHRLKSYHQLKKIMRYPFILGLVFIVIMIFLKGYVFPSFLQLFETMQPSSNTIQKSMRLLNVLTSVLMIIILALGITTLFWKILSKKLDIKHIMSIYKKIPFIRYFVKLQTSYYFATHMSMFLKTGLPLKDIISHLEKQNELKIIAYYSNLMRAELERGLYIDQLILELYFIENQISTIFKNNMSMQELEKDLAVYGELLQEKYQDKMMMVIKMIQPSFLIVLASLIIVTYLALILPMFQMIQSI